MDDQLFQPNPNQETQFSHSQPTTKHFNPKCVIAFVFVLTLGGAAYGGFWWWANRSADTSDWQTYRNEEYGFEFEYPREWKLSENGLSGSYPFVVLGNPIEGLKTYSLYILIESNPDRLSAESYVDNIISESEKEFKHNSVGGLMFSDRYKTNVGNNDGVTLYNVFEYDQASEYVFITNGPRIFKFSFPIPENNPNISEPIENNRITHQILSTFKFIDPTVSWKTYRDDKYGFEFRYPKNWSLENAPKDYGGLRLFVKVVNPAYPGKQDTDVPIEQFLVYISDSCKEEPWRTGFTELEYRTICIVYGSSYVQLELNPVDPASKMIMEQIVSTFRFYKTSEYNDSNWQSYKNDLYGFEIRYPEGWKINDQSFTYQKKNSISFEVKGPTIYTLSGYEKIGAHYSIQFHYSDYLVVDKEGFVAEIQPGDQAVKEIIVPEINKTQEHELAQIIQGTFINLIIGRVCGGGVMADGGNCPYGYVCKFPPNHILGSDDGRCEKGQN